MASKRNYLRRLDWVVILAVFGVVAIGLPYLHSAHAGFYAKQRIWMGLGVCVMLCTLAIDYQTLIRYAYVFYAAAASLLLLVLFLPPVRGAQSWIPVRLPGFHFSIQPTELMKVALILALARHLRYRETQSTLRGLVIPFLLTLFPIALLLKQPDLGSALLLPPLLFAVVFASGARVSHLVGVAAVGVWCAVPLWVFVMADYQKRRILAFLDPDRYDVREAYQLIMSRIAIASGGVWGEGLGNGTMNELDLLPDNYSDFIFGVISEEGGFVVAASLLILYLVIVCGALHIASQTEEPAGRLIAVGIGGAIGSQVLINVGVVTALLPTTGITLPLVSYGGSSIVVSFALLGLLLNVGAGQEMVIARESFTGKQRGE